jgi:DNA primase
MPEGRDPADMVQDGDATLLRKAIDDSIPLLMFRLDSEVRNHRLNEPEGRARAVRACAEIVGRLSDRVARAEYARYIVRLTGADGPAVTEAVEQAARGRKGTGTRVVKPAASRTAVRDFPPPRTGAERLEREVLRLLVSNHFGEVVVDPDWIGRADYREVFEILVAQRAETDKVDLNAVEDQGIRSFLMTIVLDDPPEGDPREIATAVHIQAIDRQIADLTAQLDHASPEEYSQLQYKLIALEKQKRELGSRGD